VEPEKEEPTNAWGELDLDESLSSSSITLERPIEMPEESDD
jgi:hypothetical protein